MNKNTQEIKFNLTHCDEGIIVESKDTLIIECKCNYPFILELSKLKIDLHNVVEREIEPEFYYKSEIINICPICNVKIATTINLYEYPSKNEKESKIRVSNGILKYIKHNNN